MNKKDYNLTFSPIFNNLLFYSLCFMFFLLPIAKSPPLIVGGFVIFIWTLSGAFIRDYKKWLLQSWSPPVLVFIVLLWIGLLWSNDVQKGLQFAIKSYYWLFAFAIASIPYEKNQYFIYSFIFGLSINVLVSLMQFLGVLPYFKEDFATGFLTGFNPYISYSLILVHGMLILSFLFNTTKKKSLKALIIFFLVAYILNLSIIHGRSGYFAFILLSPIIIYNIIGKKKLFTILLTSLTIVLLFLLSPTVQHRLSLIKSEIILYYQGEKNTSVGLRLHMWDGAIKIFLDNPLIGVGTGGFEKALQQYSPEPPLWGLEQPHNSFLFMATNFGIFGIFSLLWLFTVYLKKGWKFRNNLSGYSMLMFGTILIIGSMTDTQIFSRITGILFALYMGMNFKQDYGENA
ncbi:MAG: O-antigen ligase family protein [Thermodesulfovibrionales bacterium]|nr:O-antigen ligase family protein [Thermodesulfovibrionales bacterium]